MAHWHGRLDIDYRRDGDRTVAHDRHEGPLRVLQRLYPEGARICHHVLVHPPGGIVGGDRLDIELRVGPGAHALLTTPGATRFYRSAGALASQSLRARLAAGSRLEWLPLEAIVHSGARAENRLAFDLDVGAEMMGWDVVALGLPASDQPFVAGSLLQHLELPGVWLERGLIAAGDHTLLDGPLGLAGHRVMATLWFAAGSALDDARAESLLAAARDAATALSAGATQVQPRVVVLRALAHRVEPALQLLAAVRAAWRRIAWGLDGTAPRVWRT